MTVLTRRAFAALAIFAALYAGIGSARADQPADGAEAQNFIHTLASNALVLVNDKSLSDRDRADRFRTLFVAAFDLPEIGKFVLGRHWKTATADQQKAFVKAFEDYTVLTWSTRFKDYSGVSFTVDGASPQDDGFWQVDLRILRSQGEPLPLSWRIHKVDGAWRITDILVEGVSMALTQRQDFASAMQASGGSLDALLDAMDKKVAELQGDK